MKEVDGKTRNEISQQEPGQKTADLAFPWLCIGDKLNCGRVAMFNLALKDREYAMNIRSVKYDHMVYRDSDDCFKPLWIRRFTHCGSERSISGNVSASTQGPGG